MLYPSCTRTQVRHRLPQRPLYTYTGSSEPVTIVTHIDLCTIRKCHVPTYPLVIFCTHGACFVIGFPRSVQIVTARFPIYPSYRRSRSGENESKILPVITGRDGGQVRPPPPTVSRHYTPHPLNAKRNYILNRTSPIELKNPIRPTLRPPEPYLRPIVLGLAS